VEIIRLRFARAVRRTEIGDGLDRWRTMDSDMQALLAAIDE